jgi:hypothetical protein
MPGIPIDNERKACDAVARAHARFGVGFLRAERVARAMTKRLPKLKIWKDGDA